MDDHTPDSPFDTTYPNLQHNESGVAPSTDRRITLGCIAPAPSYSGYPLEHSGWTTQIYTSSPSYCAGNQHVWACEHTTTCKCGSATRKLPEPPKCPGCGR